MCLGKVCISDRTMESEEVMTSVEGQGIAQVIHVSAHKIIIIIS
jgi:hypothetical protein